MIRAVSPKIETPFLLEPNSVSVLIVENPHEYYQTVYELIKASQGELSDFTFWQKEEQLSFSKMGDMVLNAFMLDLCDKKIISLVIKKLQNNYQTGDYIVKLNTINSHVGCFLQELCQTVDFSLDFQELSLEDLLKISGIKPAVTYQTLLEKIICYINLYVELKNTKLFVFIGLKDILTDEDLDLLYHHCALQKVCLWLIESTKKRPSLPQEKVVIITEDLCEIVENIP